MRYQIRKLDFQPRWRRRKRHFASSHSQKKDNKKFKNQEQPELPENQTVWKYNNQCFEEETFTRLVEGVEMDSQGGEDAQQDGG